MLKKNRFDTPVFYSTDKLIKHVTEKQDMNYNDEHYSTSKIAYDGELINLEDGQIRYQRDKARQHYYKWSEEQVDDPQMTWNDVTEKLE